MSEEGGGGRDYSLLLDSIYAVTLTAKVKNPTDGEDGAERDVIPSGTSVHCSLTSTHTQTVESNIT